MSDNIMIAHWCSTVGAALIGAALRTAGSKVAGSRLITGFKRILVKTIVNGDQPRKVSGTFSNRRQESSIAHYRIRVGLCQQKYVLK